MEKLVLTEEFVKNEVVKECKKGKFIAIIFESEKDYKLLKKILKLYLSEKRGIFAYSGIVVLFNKHYICMENFFDKVFKIAG